VVLALVLAAPVLALKPDKNGDGRPDKAMGPPSHSSSVWNRTPPDDPSPAPTDAPVLVLPDTATP
jgi:hypothetical protein